MRSILLVVPMLLSASLASAEEAPLSVFVSAPHSIEDTHIELIRNELRDIPLTFLEIDPTYVVISTNRQGLERLKSISQFSVVRPVDNDLPNKDTEVQSVTRYVVSLGRIGSGSRFSTPQEAHNAKFSARVKSRKSLGSLEVSADPVRRGDLVVEGFDSSGALLERTVVRDPRVVRYEEFDQRGHLIDRRELLKNAADVEFVLPDNPRLALIRLSVATSKKEKRAIAEVTP